MSGVLTQVLAAAYATWMAASVIRGKHRDSPAWLTPIWLWLAMIWVSRMIQLSGTTLGLERIEFPGMAAHIAATGKCIGIAPSATPVDVYRARGLLWALYAPNLKAYTSYPTKRDPHYRIVFVHAPTPDVARHEAIHVLRDIGGHPDWAFDNCVKANPTHYRTALRSAE